MSYQLDLDTLLGDRHALCIGIGQYNKLLNRDLRFAVSDAQEVAKILQDPVRGNFQVTLLTDPSEVTRSSLEEILEQTFNSPNLKTEDLVLIYFSCHGGISGRGKHFYLLPSDARLDENGNPIKTTILTHYDLAKILEGTKVKNIIFILDACYSGGAAEAIQHLDLHLDLNPDISLFIIGAARHDQTAVQSSNVAHGLFTSCLLQAFEQKPRRNDGWITISEIHSFISDEIKKYDTSNIVQIQTTITAVNPNIVITKNPRYSLQSIDFYENVKKLLVLAQYVPVVQELEEAPPGFYIADLKAGIKFLRVGIISCYNKIEKVTVEEAKKFASFIKKQREKGNLDQGLIITLIELDNQVKTTIRSIGRFLEIKTYDDIWRELIDFQKYLLNISNKFENSVGSYEEVPLAQVYVPLNAETRLHDSETSISNALTTNKLKRLYSVSWQGDIEKRVRSWLSDTTTSRLALLAEYGSGKTTFCQYMAAILAKEYLEEKGKPGENRIPLLIPLLEFAKAPFDLEIYLVTYLKRHCKVDNPDFAALIKMAEAGLFFFMLDGFDEMASRASSNTIYQNIALFEELANLKRNKVLLTTRPEYFMTFKQQQQTLDSYPCLYLQPFNKEQIKLYMQKRVPLMQQHLGEAIKDWIYYYQEIDKIHDLSDLARRPVLLEMIIKTLPMLIKEGKDVNRPNLYQSYLEGELKRQLLKQRHDLQINIEKHLEVMERIAWELYVTDKVAITSNHIIEISKELLTPEQQWETEGSLREIVTCSFLIRTGNEYQFSHESFMEYLVACSLAKDISMNKQEKFAQKLIKSTIRDFMVEMDIYVRNKIKNNLYPDTYLYFDHKILVSWFHDHRKTVWTSCNVISILARLLDHEQLCDLPLNRANLSGADLSEADLSGADLSEANLSGADLSEADLSGADLSEANLSGADLSEANLSGADLSEANLSGADLRYASLDFVVFKDANLSNANLKYASLDFVVFKGANLSNANLIYSHLHNADFYRAELRHADIFGADLSRANLRNLNLSLLNLRRASLYNADLSGANLNLADLNGADLRRANLSGVDLSGVDLRRADLDDAKLDGANLSEVDLSGADLSGFDLREISLNNADLSGANLSGADLSGADLSGANLSGADLSEVVLRGLSLSGANLQKVDLHEIDLSGADLSEADLRRVNLQGSILIDTNLSEANLQEADLSDTDLTRANFTKANLSNSILSDANLSNAILDNALLNGTNLNGAKLKLVYLARVDLSHAKLRSTDLSNANFTNANLEDVDLSEAYLGELDLEIDILRNAIPSLNFYEDDQYEDI